MKHRLQVKTIRDAMERKNYDAVQLAEASGVDVTLVRRYIEDDSSKWVVPLADNARRIAAALDLDPMGIMLGFDKVA